MMIIGLTGGIGSGKTTVGKMFKKLGIPVYNSDKQAKKLMRSSKRLIREIKELLGEETYVDGKLNRVFIASQVFNDKTLLENLNALVHPAVRRHFKKWAKKQTSPYVIQESAILFENGMQDFYEKTILVTAPEEIRIKRLLERDNASTSGIKARMKNQWKDSKKRVLADFIIDNIEKSKTLEQVNQVHALLLDHSRG